VRVAEFARLAASISANGPFTFELIGAQDLIWDQCLTAMDDQPVGYARAHAAYQHAYFSAAFPDYSPLDCLICWQGKPIGIWLLAFIGTADKPRLSSNLNGSAGVAPPLIPRNLPEKTSKAAARQWMTLLGQCAALFGVETVRLLCPATGALVAWQRLAMENGAQLSGTYRAIVDLTLSEEAYHRRLRKSYKALINAARQHWQVRVDTTGDEKSFQSFEALHLEIAGRRTRPEESWKIQFESIVSQDAFAVYLEDQSEKLVGASLFNKSRDEVIYAVGVYDRRLFDKPLAHLSLYSAIRHSRNLGARAFILGERPYPGDRPEPTEKELQIAFFKEGFATELPLAPTLSIPGNALREIASD
jgi:FemAB family protein